MKELKQEAWSCLAQALGTLLAGVAICASAQTNDFPPIPQAPTNTVKRLARPVNMRASITVSFDYTNIVYPFYTNSDLTSTNWGLATNVVGTISATFPIDSNMLSQFFRVGCPIYTAPIQNTNLP